MGTGRPPGRPRKDRSGLPAQKAEKRKFAEAAYAAGQFEPERGEEQWLSPSASAAYLGLAHFQFTKLVRTGAIQRVEMHRAKVAGRFSIRNNRYSLAELRAYAESKMREGRDKAWPVPPRLAAEILGLSVMQLQRKLQDGEIKDLHPYTVRKLCVQACLEEALTRLSNLGLGKIVAEAFGAKKEACGSERSAGNGGPVGGSPAVHPVH